MEKKTKKSNIIIDLIISIFVAFTFFIFGPCEIIMAEPIEFWFGVLDIIDIVLISFSCVFILVFCLLRVLYVFFNNTYYYLRAIITGVGLALYIQGNWMFVQYGKMDGTAINWEKYRLWGIINTILWCGIVFVVVLLQKQFKDKSHVIYYVLAGIVGVELLTLITLALQNGVNHKTGYSLNGGNEFELSRNHENIIVICADGFDGRDLLPVFSEEPELEDSFDGFTFYKDTVGTSLFSEESAITLLTGNQFVTDLSFKDNVDNAYKNTDLYDVLQENNYNSYIFLKNEKMISPLIVDKISNCRFGNIKINSKKNAFKKIYKMVSFRYMPHFLKKIFWYSSSDLGDLKNNNIIFRNYDVYDYVCSDGVSAKDTESNIYQFFWIQGPHEPANTDRFCRKAPITVAMDEDDYSKKQFEQTIGVVRLFATINNQLKKNDCYDNTTIIYLADHGWDVRPNPLLLIKPRDSHGQINVSDAPVSMIEDYLNTLEYLITEKKVPNESTVFDIAENQDRQRPFLVYDIDTRDRTYGRIDKYYYGPGDLSLDIRFGNIVSPVNIQCHAISGISICDVDYVWNDGTESKLKFHIEEEFENLELEMSYFTYLPYEHVEVYANDTLISKFVASGNESKRLVIPGADISNGDLELRFVFEDAIEPAKVDKNSPDERKLALGFKSLLFTSTNEEFQIENQIDSYYDDESKYEVTLGKTINPTGIGLHSTYGFSTSEGAIIWNDGTKSNLKFHVGEEFENIELEISYFTYLPYEHVEVYANDTLISKFVAAGEGIKRIVIPRELIIDGMVELGFIYLDAVKPANVKANNSDERELALAFKEMILSSTKEAFSLEKQISNGYKLGEKVFFSKEREEECVGYIGSGFSGLEKDAVWTDGNEAHLSFWLNDNNSCDIRFIMHYIVYDGPQNIKVYVNGNLIDDYIAEGDEEKELVISSELLKDNMLDVGLELSDAHSPKSNGESEDERLLGVYLKSIYMEENDK